MTLAGDSVLIGMRPLLIITSAFFASGFGTAQAGTSALSAAIPAYSRDAQGIAMAVTELLPSIDNCVSAHQALGGQPDVSFEIAFDVSTEGEVAGLIIESPQLPTTGLDSCIEGTLSAMRFAPGVYAIPVQMPLTASVKTDSQLY
jgi:hypothetical protein